ncbi:hypothetical protein Tco_1190863, partial [Tanacetum coccineum]
MNYRCQTRCRTVEGVNTTCSKFIKLQVSKKPSGGGRERERGREEEKERERGREREGERGKERGGERERERERGKGREGEREGEGEVKKTLILTQARVKIEQQLAAVQESQRQDQEDFRKL